jgi:acetolactate synthase II small subunit
MMNSYRINLTLLNMDGGLDPLVRALNVVRRGKVNVKAITVSFNRDAVNVDIYVEGVEDEVNWVCNKLNKLYDVADVSYTASISIPKAQALLMGERNG